MSYEHYSKWTAKFRYTNNVKSHQQNWHMNSSREIHGSLGDFDPALGGATLSQ